jgi:hypothetical protein
LILALDGLLKETGTVIDAPAAMPLVETVT